MNGVSRNRTYKRHDKCNKDRSSETFPKNKSAEMTKSLLFAQQTNGVPLSF